MALKISQPAPPAKEVPADIIATAIVEIADGVKAVNSSRLTRKAIVALIHDQSKISKRTIEEVLNNLSSLEADWLKPKK